MITNDGKELISKYLLGQVSSYATHLAIGCGSKINNVSIPLEYNSSGPSIVDLSEMKKLEFEMARVPITSRGFVDDPYYFDISNKQRSGSTAIITTTTPHNYSVGESVVVSDVGSPFDGTFVITAVTTNTFSYKTSSSGTIASTAVSPFGTALVSRTKISLTAELPAENRYEISEVGIWSAPNNSLAINSDSHMLFNFSESWQGHASSVFNPTFYTNLGSGSNIDQSVVKDLVLYTASDNVVLQTLQRKNRREGSRFLNNTILVRGDSSAITGSSGQWQSSNVTHSITNKALTDNVVTLTTSVNHSIVVGQIITITGVDATFNGTYTVTAIPSNTTFSYDKSAANIPSAAVTPNGTVEVPATHIHLNNVNFNIGQNSSSDILSLAFSLVDRDSLGNGEPDSVKILLEFYRNEISTENAYAKAEIQIDGTEFSGNRYHVYSMPISELVTAADFSASDIRVCRVFSSVIQSGAPSSVHYLSFDGMRIDNITTDNPLYKLSGYSVVKTANGHTIVKSSNTNNYIEFRFNLGVG